MDDIEVRELRYFIAVAEELGIARAAQRLGMTQPPLSRAIRKIERRLGVQLFERGQRHITLTPAGHTLFDEARSVLDVISAATERTRRAAEVAPKLIVTAKPGIASTLLQAIVDCYAALPDTPPVDIAVSGHRRQADMIRRGEADVALVTSPSDDRGLASEPLLSEPRVVVLPVEHELAGREALRCQDLYGWPVPQWPQSTFTERIYWSGRDRDSAFQLDGRSGPPPGGLLPDGPTVYDVTELLEVVSLGQAIALIPASVAERNPRADVSYRPVIDASPSTIAIAWPEHARARPVARFVRTALELANRDFKTD